VFENVAADDVVVVVVLGEDFAAKLLLPGDVDGRVVAVFRL